MFCLSNFILSFFQVLTGNPAQKNVICGNATAQIVGYLLLPICHWLTLKWIMEQPELCLHLALQVVSSVLYTHHCGNLSIYICKYIQIFIHRHIHLWIHINFTICIYAFGKGCQCGSCYLNYWCISIKESVSKTQIHLKVRAPGSFKVVELASST